MSEVEEAMTDLMGDEDVLLELQSILRSPPAQANPENVAVVQPRVIAHRLQEAVHSRPQEQGVKRERQESGGVERQEPQRTGSLDRGQDSKALIRLQALHVWHVNPCGSRALTLRYSRFFAPCP